MNIIITSAGQRVCLLESFKKEAAKYDKNIKVFSSDMKPELAPACYISDKYFKLPPVTDLNYIDLLLDICLTNEIKLIIPTIDTELLILSKNYKKFLDFGIIVLISDYNLITKCRDKRKSNFLFNELNIEIPLQYDKYNLKYPLFIKPYNGSLSKDIFLINNENELDEKFFNDERFMFMEYINPIDNDEYTVDAYYSNVGYLKCLVPRKRITVRAGEINKGITKKNILYDILKRKLNYIDGARGCLTFQFFLNKKTNNIKGIEINPRFGGGYPLSYEAGANYPEYIIQEYLFHEEIDFIDKWNENLLMLRYDNAVFVHNFYEE